MKRKAEAETRVKPSKRQAMSTPIVDSKTKPAHPPSSSNMASPTPALPNTATLLNIPFPPKEEALLFRTWHNWYCWKYYPNERWEWSNNSTHYKTKWEKVFWVLHRNRGLGSVGEGGLRVREVVEWLEEESWRIFQAEEQQKKLQAKAERGKNVSNFATTMLNVERSQWRS